MPHALCSCHKTVAKLTQLEPEWSDFAKQRFGMHHTAFGIDVTAECEGNTSCNCISYKYQLQKPTGPFLFDSIVHQLCLQAMRGSRPHSRPDLQKYWPLHRAYRE
jgi:hypothetical protein